MGFKTIGYSVAVDQSPAMLWRSFVYLFFFFDAWTTRARRHGRSNDLAGVHLRITAYHVPPIMTITKDAGGNKTYGGFNKDVCDWIADWRTNTTYEFVEDDPKNTAKHGLVVGCLKMVEEGRADLCTMGMSPDPDRVRLVDFTGPVAVTRYHLLNPYPKEESRLYGPVRPFQLQVWIVFFATLIGLPLAFSALLALKWRREEDAESTAETSFSQSLRNSVAHTLRIIVDQGGALSDNRLHVRLANGCWLLMALVLIAAYKGNLTSYMAIPNLKPMPSTFQELAARTDLQMMVERNTKFSQMFLAAESGYMKVLGDSLRANPQFMFAARADANKLALKDERTVWPGMDLVGHFVVEQWRQNLGRCRFAMARKPTDRIRMYNWPMKKNGPYSAEITKRIQTTWETGLNSYWYKSYRPVREVCRTQDRVLPQNTSLKLEDLSSAFLLLGVGLGLSVLAFLVELTVAARRRRLQAATEEP